MTAGYVFLGDRWRWIDAAAAAALMSLEPLLYEFNEPVS
jgi:hypothetical protein